MKKKLILMCVAGVLVMTAIIGGTLAGFNTSTEQKGVSNITVKDLGISLDGSNKEIGDSLETETVIAAPGGEQTLQHNVLNDVAEGYTLYTRVTINKKWSDPNLDASKIHMYAGSGEAKAELKEGITVNNWIVWYEDAEQVIMYYTMPLAAGEESANLIDSVSFEADMNNAYADAEALISFDVDAVQEIAAEDSIPAEWGVYPTFDADGKITSIEE